MKRAVREAPSASARSLLAGRAGLVLGVSGPSSVGHHCVRDLTTHGARVAFSQRPGCGSESLARELGVPAVNLDVLDEGSVERAFAELGTQFERLDFLVHGLVSVPEGCLQKSVLQVSKSDFALALEIGARSLLVTTRCALPLLRRSPSPRIVVLLSPGAEFAIPNYHLVGIAKGALTSAIRYLALELGPQGIACNGVNFSMLETAAASRVLGKETVKKTRSYVSKHSFTQVPLQFGHVTNTIAFLASETCQNLTGEILTVDGGYSRNYF